MTHRAYVGLGSNLDDPRGQIDGALAGLARIPQLRVESRSPLYRSAPIGGPPQPDYVNAVARLDTALAPADLLAALQSVERRHGRTRTLRDAPRTLDLDLLLYDDLRLDDVELTVPHPRMHQRAFVLRPLLDLAPGIDIPGIGPAAALIQQCNGQRIERLA